MVERTNEAAGLRVVQSSNNDQDLLQLAGSNPQKKCQENIFIVTH